MSISRIKPSGWAPNEELTSVQMTDVDINTSYALDKRAGQTDTLSSTVTMASGSSLTLSSGSTLTGNIGSTVSLSSTVNLNQVTNFGLLSTANFSGAINFANSSVVNVGTGSIIYSGTTVNGTQVAGLTYNSGSNILFNTGSTVLFAGTTRITANSLRWNSPSSVTFGHIDNTTPSGGGVLTTIAGQNATGTTSFGGDLVLTSGTGTSVSGGLYLQGGGTTFMIMSPNAGFIQATKPMVMLGSTFYSASSSIAYSATVNIDCNTGNTFVIGTLTGNITISLTNVRDGAIYSFYTVQDATGGRTVAFSGSPSLFYFYGTMSSNVNTASNKVNIYHFLGRVIGGVQYLYALSINSF